jgi:AmmeMemoRadiSam system protein A
LFNDAFDGEHAIEVQLPILQAFFDDVNIIPIVVGNTKHGNVERIIEKFWPDQTSAFLVSSDLSHFHSYEEAVSLDSSTYDAIENCDSEGFEHDRACGATAICGVMNFAAKNNFSLIRIGSHNSGNATGNKDRVVGYGAWMLVECQKNKFIKDHFADEIVSLCYESIATAFKRGKAFVPANIPAVLRQLGASFVTLKINNDLRGCIGSIRAHQPLIIDLLQNARSAAFRDPRFLPLAQEELDKITIHISLLSHPRRIQFEHEQDLLDTMVPGMDGIIIRDGIFQAVYLPCVWEQLPDKVEFLASLKCKAGLPRDHFSKTFEAFRFHSEYF